MAACRQGTQHDSGIDLGKTVPSPVRNGKIKESREVDEGEDKSVSPQDSVSTGIAIPVTNPCSLIEVSSRRATIRARPGHDDDRFKDNPLGEGCWRWFCIDSGHPTSKVPRSEDKPSTTNLEIANSSENVDKPKYGAPGFDHKGFCDTPGMNLLKDGVRAVRKTARRMPILNTRRIDVLRSGFKFVKSRYRGFVGQGTRQLKGKLAEKTEKDAVIQD